MVARTVKTLLHEIMRNELNTAGSTPEAASPISDHRGSRADHFDQEEIGKEQSLKRLVVDSLNRIFGNSSGSERFWQLKIQKRLAQKYEDCLSSTESSASFSLKSYITRVPRSLASIEASFPDPRFLLFSVVCKSGKF